MENISPLLVGFVQLLAVLLLLGVATERGTQVVKEFIRLIGSRFPAFDFSGRKAFILAAVIAFGITYFFGVDVTQYLKLLDGFDPELVKMVNALLLMFVSTSVHDKLYKSDTAVG